MIRIKRKRKPFCELVSLYKIRLLRILYPHLECMDLDHNKLGRYGSPIKLWGKKVWAQFYHRPDFDPPTKECLAPGQFVWSCL